MKKRRSPDAEKKIATKFLLELLTPFLTETELKNMQSDRHILIYNAGDELYIEYHTKGGVLNTS